MSVQELPIPVLQDTSNAVHVDSPRTTQIHLVAKELSETVSAESPDATVATADVSYGSDHEDMPSISLKDAIPKPVILKETQHQVEQDISIINEEDTHEDESIQSNVNGVTIYSMSVVAGSGVDHDKVGSDETTVESITDSSSTEVETVVVQPETRILDKADDVAENGGHGREVEVVGIKIEESTIEPIESLDEVKLKLEVANDGDEEVQAVTGPLVDIPSSTIETYLIPMDPTPAEGLVVIDPTSEPEVPAVVNVKTVEPLVDTQQESVAELATAPVAPVLVGVGFTTIEQVVPELEEEIVFAPAPPEPTEHVFQSETEQVAHDAAKEEPEVQSSALLVEAVFERKVEPVVESEDEDPIGDTEAAILEDLSTEPPVDVVEDKVQAEESDGDNTIPVIDDREGVAVDGPVDEELPVAEADSDASTPTKQSITVGHELTGDSNFQSPIELVISEEAKSPVNTEEPQHNEVAPSTEESESLADLSEQRDIPVSVESLESIEEGVDVPILDVRILEEADKNEPLELGEEIFSPLEAEIVVFESFKVPAHDYGDEVTESESKESLNEDFAVGESAEEISVEILAPLTVDEVTSPAQEDVIQKKEAAADQVPEEEVAADVEVSTPAVDNILVAEPVSTQEEILVESQTSVPVVDDIAVVEPETETSPAVGSESTETILQAEPVSIEESISVEDEVSSEVIEITIVPVEHVEELEPKEISQDSITEETKDIPISDNLETMDHSVIPDNGEIAEVPAAVEVEESEDVLTEHMEDVLPVETEVLIPANAESVAQPTVVEFDDHDEHVVVDETLPESAASVTTLGILQEGTECLKSPWTPSYSANTQGGSSDIEHEVEELQQLPPALATPSTDAPETVETKESNIPEDSILVKTDVEEIPPVLAEELQQPDVDVSSEAPADVIEAHNANDSDFHTDIASEQADVDFLVTGTEDTPDERPKSPWTPSYSVTTLRGSSPRAESKPELEEDAELSLSTSESLLEQDTVLRALPTVHQPDVLIAESVDEQPATELQLIVGEAESADTLDDEVRPEPVVVESFELLASEPEVDLIPVESDIQTLAIAKEDLPEERPKSPWTPSYSVTTLHGSGSHVDSTEVEDLEQLPTPIFPPAADEPAVLESANTQPVEDAAEDQHILQEDVQATEEATEALNEPKEPVVVEGYAPLLSEVKEGEQDFQEAKLGIPGDVPKRPWTPSYSSYTQGPGAADDADEDKDSISSEPVDSKGDISVDTEDSFHAEVQDTNVQDFPGIGDSLDTLPEKPALESLQPVDPSSSMLSARSRYESTTSSRLFPGGWFSSTSKSVQDEGRTSMDEAAGEFIPSKAATAPTEPIVEETSEEEQKVEEKKSRWCTIM